MRVLLIFTLINYTFGDAPNQNPKNLEAKIVLNKSFFRSYSENLKPGNIQLEIVIPLNLAKTLGILLEKHKVLRNNKHEESQPTWHRDLRTVPELVNYLMKSSHLRFKSIIEKYYKELIKGGTQLEITPEINATLSVYKLNFHKHINMLLKESPRNQMDKDLILLDIIDTSCSLLYEGTLICLQVMVDRHLPKGTGDIKTVTDEVFKKTLRKKRQDLKLLCNMTRVCRPFPGFSEYLVDLLDEVIKLPDSKFHTLVMKTMVIIENKQDDIILVLGKDLIKDLGKHLKDLVYGELTEIKRSLSDKRKEILERYRWKKLTESTRAFRILLDIIDKAFVMIKTDKVAKHFAVTIKALRNWKYGDTIDIGQVLSIFFNHVVKTLIINWRGEINKEARTLVQITIGGHIDNQHEYHYLFSNGSNYINSIL